MIQNYHLNMLDENIWSNCHLHKKSYNGHKRYNKLEWDKTKHNPITYKNQRYEKNEKNCT
jgi:hypothetical protein